MSKTQETQTSWESVLVDGYKMPIIFYNPENMSAPYTTKNVAESVFQTLTTEGVSKIALNKFRISIVCASKTTYDEWGVGKEAFVQLDDTDANDFATAVSVHVYFDGSVKSIVALAHELVHVAQYASRRLKCVWNFNKADWVYSFKLSETNQIQKGTHSAIAYNERVWEWEAFAKQTYIASDIYTAITGYGLSGHESRNSSNASRRITSLRIAAEWGWNDLPLKIVCAVGDARVCRA